MRYYKFSISIWSLCLILGLGSCKNEDGIVFSKLSSSHTNVKFINALSDSEDFNVMNYGYFYNGGGVAAADFNNDGYTDLFFTANIALDKLYINKGNGSITFEDKTAISGIDIKEGWKTGVSVVDINNDGWMDIYVCRSAAEKPNLRRNLLFVNNKNLTFTESAAQYGLDDPGYSTQAVFFDYDKDGDLDCYILNHSIQKYAGYSQNLISLKSQDDPNYTSRLMQNVNGKYQDVTQASGMISNVLSFGLGVMVSDYNGDGWLDIYVSNDYNEEDYLYINQTDGSFSESIKTSTSYTSLFSMGSDAADINDDGNIDLITLDMLPEKNERIKMTSGDDNYEKYQNLIASGFHPQYMRNMLQLNTGNDKKFTTPKGSQIPQFKEIGQSSGVSNTDWSWSALIADYDNDGAKDIFITNGYEKDYTNMDFLNYTVDLQTKLKANEMVNKMEVIANMPSISECNYLYKNDGKLNFTNVAPAWGIIEKNISAGAIYADLDNDGDLDLVTNNLNSEASIYKNNTKNINKNHISVDLKGATQSQLIGAKIMVYSPIKTILQEYIPVRGFQSSSQQPIHFGLGNIDKIDSIKVFWMDGSSELIKSPPINQKIAVTKSKNITKYPLSNFIVDNSKTELLPFTHKQDYIADFKIQPLLPYAISAIGPKVISSIDQKLVYISGSRLQAGHICRVSEGKVNKIATGISINTEADESDAAFVDIDNDDDEDLVIVYSGYNVDPLSPSLRPKIFLNAGNNQFTYQANLIGQDVRINASTIIPFDYDKDGDTDLFIGSRCKPMKYPQSMPSLLLTNEKTQIFSVKPEHSFNIGMVTSAGITKNKDGFYDLLIAREFDTVLKFTNRKGIIDFTKKESITASGLWYSLAISDSDNDGDEDIFLGNLGTNNQLSFVSDTAGLTLYDYPFLGIAKSIPVLCINEDGHCYPFPARDELLSQIPSLKKKYDNYKSYAMADVDHIFGKELLKANKYTASTLESIMLTNENGTYKTSILPKAAQYAPIHAIKLIDINNDGYSDLMMGGNILNTRVRIGSMLSSSVSLFLNNKKGGFEYLKDFGIKGQVSSIKELKTRDIKSFIIGINNQNAVRLDID